MFKKFIYGEDPNQFGELTLPGGAGPHPVVLFIHGGFWRAKYDLTPARPLCAAIAGAGCAVWSVEYRRVGQSGGGYPGTLGDIDAAARFLTQIPDLDMNRVVAAGHSAGGHLALWLAAQESISLKSVVSLAGVSDLRLANALNLSNGAVADFVGCSPTDCPNRYAVASPVELLPMKVPQILLHGTADDVVPFEISERFAKASANATLIPLPGTDHHAIINPDSKEWPTVLQSLLSAL